MTPKGQVTRVRGGIAGISDYREGDRKPREVKCQVCVQREPGHVPHCTSPSVNANKKVTETVEIFEDRTHILDY